MITALRGTGSEGCDVVREILTACVREVKTKHKYFLTAIMRASAFYNINDHFYLGATALLNNMRFDSEDNVKLQMKDWIVNAQFGIRF